MVPATSPVPGTVPGTELKNVPHCSFGEMLLDSSEHLSSDCWMLAQFSGLETHSAHSEISALRLLCIMAGILEVPGTWVAGEEWIWRDRTLAGD